jgi:hypothetical protein
MAVAAALEPPPPEKLTDGADVYPDPASTTETATTAPPWIAAIAKFENKH